MTIVENEDKRKVCFVADNETVSFVKEQLGVQSLSLTLRKLLLIFANDKDLQERTVSLNCDTQKDYERLQTSKKKLK